MRTALLAHRRRAPHRRGLMAKAIASLLPSLPVDTVDTADTADTATPDRRLLRGGFFPLFSKTS